MQQQSKQDAHAKGMPRRTFPARAKSGARRVGNWIARQFRAHHERMVALRVYSQHRVDGQPDSRAGNP